MIQFLKLIASNWIGAVVGLGVAFILCLVLRLTVFKGNATGWVLGIIISIACALLGVLIQNTFFNKNDASKLPTAQERVEMLTNGISTTWKNDNAGFTKEQILVSQDDENCPTYDDQILNFAVQDFGEYVNFSFFDGTYHQNINLLKTDNGLVVDGLMNMTGSFDTGGLGFVVYLDKWNWHDERNILPYYKEQTLSLAWTSNNQISVSSGHPSYLLYSYWGKVNSGEGLLAEAMRQGIKLTANNTTDKFTKWGNIELVGTAETATRSINTFFNYLYEQVKGEAYNTKKLVDCLGLLCLPIPEELRINFPTSKEFQKQFPDVKYYGVFNCDIAVNLTYKQGNKALTTTSGTDNYLDTNKDDDGLKIDKIDTKQEFSKVFIDFANTSKNDISKVDLVNNPVTITFTCEKLQQTKTVVIDDITKITHGFTTLLARNNTWTYTIKSRCLIFDEKQTPFRTDNISQSHRINYSYVDNHITFGLAINLGVVDEDIIDLQTTPITITLSNDKNEYTFEFTNNSELNTYKYQYVECDTYDYLIDVEDITLEPNTGTITVSQTNQQHIFNFTTETAKYLLEMYVTPSTSMPTSYMLIIPTFTNELSAKNITSIKFNYANSTQEISFTSSDVTDEQLTRVFEVSPFQNNMTITITYANGTTIQTQQLNKTYEIYRIQSITVIRATN